MINENLRSKNKLKMSKIGLIISQEYRNRVAKKSFLLMTFLTPILMAALIVTPIFLASIKDDEERVVAVGSGRAHV